MYAAYKNSSRVAGCARLQVIATKMMLKYVFSAWLADYKEGRKVRLWFNHEGRGEGEEEAEDEWYWSEGKDPLSTLPRIVAIKVK